MRRTNLCAEPAETIDALDGDPSDWRDFKNGSRMSLQPGQYVASCNVTERGSAKARIQYWDQVHHLQLGEVYGAAIGVNVMRIDPQTAPNKCNFPSAAAEPRTSSSSGPTLTLLLRGWGFRASSPQAPRHTEPIKAGDRR